MAPPTYTPMKTEDSDTYYSDSQDDSSTTPRKFGIRHRKLQAIHYLFLVQSILLLCSCALLVATWTWTWRPVFLRYGSFQTGWRDTELHAAFDAIKMHTMTISQPATTNIGPPQSKYVGVPSEEMDNAWRILVAPTVLNLDDNEIGDYAGQTTKTELGWTAGVQVYHSLHCINALRRAVYQHVYGAPSAGELYHLDHCIDMLRLGTQCQSDLTPMLYFDTNGTMGIKPHEHTCRNFEAIHAWAKKRSRCGDDEQCAIMFGKQVGAEM